MDMRIAEIEVRCCRHKAVQLAAESLRESAEQTGLEFLVVTLTTRDGARASSFGFAGRSARGSGELAAAAMRPFLTGRDCRDREGIWQAFRTEDRWWNLLPIYSYGPFDIALWLLAAQAADQPLYKFIGACRDTVPTYCSSLVLPTPQAYAAEAVAVKGEGYKAYKVHPRGQDFGEDLAIHRSVRDAVGPDFTLMSDPVGCFNLEDAIRFGRELEHMNYLWLEEPLFDENIHSLRELSRVLDIPIVGTEVIAKHPYSVAECISTRVVDRVRADVSWTGGVTGVLKTATLAEAFGVNCEIHTSILHPLELVNLHCAAAVSNCSYFELLTPVQTFAFGLVEPLPVANGIATLPNRPGLSIDLDWDLIDDCTFKIL
ncbi:MAG: enolase C-terminal domain-like protein [Pseudomonadota bacterium]|nr:enolase C-terminal domain-like protein [Pseudomonadota bacterium]